MRPSRWSASCLLILLELMAEVALARNSLCINADNIDKLYVNGEDVSSELPNKAVARKCDCIQLPLNTTTIAVRASKRRDEAGLQACRSTQEAVYRGWRCVNAYRVEGMNWFSPNYSTEPWKKARRYTFPSKPFCQNQHNLPCRTKNRNEWFWAVGQVQNVACRIDYCSPSCYGCKSAGAGRCDPDKCTHGASTDNGTVVLDADGFVTCQRKCCINVKATNKTETPNGYIRVTDVETGVVDNWEATEAGRYLATIDLETCTTTRRNYTNWDNARFRTGDTLNAWKDPSFYPELENMFGIDLAVGNGTRSYAPWIDIWELGTLATNARYGNNAPSTRIKFCMQGINNYDVGFTDVEITRYVNVT